MNFTTQKKPFTFSQYENEIQEDATHLHTHKHTYSENGTIFSIFNLPRLLNIYEREFL